MSRITVCLAVLGGALYLTWASAPVLAGSQGFDLVNRSGSHLCYLYASPKDKDTWAEDILNAECLEPGKAVRIGFDGAGQTTAWDLRIEDENGQSETYRDIDLTKVHTITILGGGKARYD